MGDANAPISFVPTAKAPKRMFPCGTGSAAEAHTWSEASKPFDVRSKTYVEDKVKIESGCPLLKLVDADVLLAPSGKSGERIDNMSTKPDSYARYLREQCKDERRIFVVTFQMHPRYLVLTFVETDRPANELTEAGALLNQFFTNAENGGWTDESCAQRLKLIPRIENFSVPGVNLNRPTIIANKITCAFHRAPGLVEVNVNVFSSRVTKFILGYIESAASKLVVELAFALEGATAAELPERTLGTVRLLKVDLAEETTRILEEE
uniref:Protein ENHANCED DISEASE RESISTANCE 2 C-terminal domain-containing protein n=1 Tax=Spongospora subterranea TaxID=70186 RepID=A0A0H5R6M8_9EUKA|eukprot:CRZ09773.1 hypothetical protein [Spongospora subterranea]